MVTVVQLLIFHLNGEVVGSLITVSGDPMGQGGYYEAQFVFDVTDPEAPCFDTDNGATDAFGDSCDGYTTFPSWVVDTMMMILIQF